MLANTIEPRLIVDITTLREGVLKVDAVRKNGPLLPVFAGLVVAGSGRCSSDDFSDYRRTS
jgi:hypothetical protein